MGCDLGVSYGYHSTAAFPITALTNPQGLDMTKVPLPSSKEDKAAAYLAVLMEINARLQIINITKSSGTLHGIAREICYLQLRHICELVAIGCLVIQGDYTISTECEYSPAKYSVPSKRNMKGLFRKTQ